GLVNMNGRIYDPVLGRFLSPDPNVQFVGDLQSYNRYSYVLNNPLRYTDPTGFSALGGSSILVNVGWTFAGIAICGGDVMCGYFFAMMGIMYNTHTAVASGASLGQVGMNVAIGIFSAQLGGA